MTEKGRRKSALFASGGNNNVRYSRSVRSAGPVISGGRFCLRPATVLCTARTSATVSPAFTAIHTLLLPVYSRGRQCMRCRSRCRGKGRKPYSSCATGDSGPTAGRSRPCPYRYCLQQQTVRNSRPVHRGYKARKTRKTRGGMLLTDGNTGVMLG